MDLRTPLTGKPSSRNLFLQQAVPPAYTSNLATLVSDGASGHARATITRAVKRGAETHAIKATRNTDTRPDWKAASRADQYLRAGCSSMQALPGQGRYGGLLLGPNVQRGTMFLEAPLSHPLTPRESHRRGRRMPTFCCPETNMRGKKKATRASSAQPGPSCSPLAGQRHNLR